MRALVTGASGFVGRHLVAHLVSCGDTVLATGFPVAPADAQAIVPLDVCDVEACARVISEFKPDAVYHLAGLAFVPDSERDFAKALLINVAGFEHIVRVCHQLQNGIRILYVSSGEVYGKITASQLPLKESTPAHPANNYSLTKLMGELVAERYTRLGEVEVVIARPFNHIGPGQDVRFVTASFAAQLAAIKAGTAPAVLYVGNLSAKRDFSDVRDMVRAYRLALEKGHGIYNFGAGCAVSIQKILDTLIEQSGVSVSVQLDPARMRPQETPEVYCDISKAKKELNWAPQLSLPQTLRDVFLDAQSRCLLKKNSSVS